MRSKADVLRDHICKEMNDLNLERCRCAEHCVYWLGPIGLYYSGRVWECESVLLVF
jgi:hypothetical protein